MRILFVTPVVPSRAYGRRPYNFLRCLRDSHDLAVATFLTDPGYDRPYIEELRSWGVEVHAVRQPKVSSAARCLAAPFTDRPLRALYVESGALRRLIRQLADAHRPDIYHFDRMRMGQYAEGLDRNRCVVDFTDSIPLYLERRRWRDRPAGQRLVDWWERRTIPAFEERVLQLNSIGILCSEIDTGHFLDLHPGANIRTIYNMVDPEEWHPKEDTSGIPCGVYTGTLSYAPNVDALAWLVAEILPFVWRELPHFRLRVYGTRPGSNVRALLRDDRIELAADVPRLADEVSQRDIYLCPIRVGSGMRNKILEAMATGMAVVSTKVGCEGLPVTDGKQIALADRAEDFAREVARLARDHVDRERMGEAGRDYVLRHHHPDIIGPQLEAVYREMAGRDG